jgi:heme-degrading monooxygenase HmoA
MRVTELIIFRLLPSFTITNPEVLSVLSISKQTLQNYTRLPWTGYNSIEDPSLLYILGGWPSIEVHLEEFDPSPQGERLRQLAAPFLQLESYFHIDVDPLTLALNERTLSIGRNFVEPEKKCKFEEVYEKVKHYLEAFIGRKELVKGGWRIDKDPAKRGEEEFVLFTWWESLEKQKQFAKTKGGKKYFKLKDETKGVDIKHGLKYDV